MADDFDEIIEASEPCEEIVEYDDIIVDDDIEIEPEEDYDQQSVEINTGRDDAERQFARYELSYRSRRIRELTMASPKKKDRRKSKQLAA